MSTPFARRNDPCPCGSGLKYKACHGRLDAAAPAAATSTVPSDEALGNGLAAMRNGQADVALAWFDRVLAAQSEQPFAMHFKGYALAQKGDFRQGVPLLERAVALEPANPDFHGNLGIVRMALGELGAARASLERAIALEPRMAEAHSNLSMTVREMGDFQRAYDEASAALALNGNLAPARINLAMALLSLARYREAWKALNWRPNPVWNIRDAAVPGSLPHAVSLPDFSADPWITLHGEQGLGDTLFFLRWAPELVRRGARPRFWGDARLIPMLRRTGLFGELVAARDPSGGALQSRLVWVGDLPGYLEADDFPPSLALVADAARRAAVGERLRALGPPPYVALTWRAGLERRGRTVLAKAIEPVALGEAIRGVRATFLSLQRLPAEGELDALGRAAGAAVHDLSALNDDLEDMLAVLETVDEYVGVSNTNMHLRAGTARAARVLVPYPPEWRWIAREGIAPWFARFAVYRAEEAGGWTHALARLGDDLRAAVNR